MFYSISPNANFNKSLFPKNSGLFYNRYCIINSGCHWIYTLYKVYEDCQVALKLLNYSIILVDLIASKKNEWKNVSKINVLPERIKLINEDTELKLYLGRDGSSLGTFLVKCNR